MRLQQPGYYNNEGAINQGKGSGVLSSSGFKQNANWARGPVAYYGVMSDFRSAGNWDEKFAF